MSEVDCLKIYTDHLHQNLLLSDNFYKNMYLNALHFGKNSSISQSAEIKSSNLNESLITQFGWVLIIL